MRSPRPAMLVLLAVTSSAAANPAPDPDLETMRPRMRVFTDTKGHVMVLASRPRDPSRSVKVDAFYGDPRSVTRFSVEDSVESYTTFGPDDKVIQTTWHIRNPQPVVAKLTLASGVLTAVCRDRAMELTEVEGEARRKVLDKLVFKPAVPARIPFLLARDDGTTYYYLDRRSEGRMDSDVHLYVGKRGAMRRQKIVDMAWDAAGFVLITSSGRLRGTPSDSRHDPWVTAWTPSKKGSAPMTLIDVPMSGDTKLMIYGDLGVYTGLRFGTPCDDL